MPAATAAKRATWPRNATNLATLTPSLAATARRRATSAVIAPSQEIGPKSSALIVQRVSVLLPTVSPRFIPANLATVGHTKVRCKSAINEADDNDGAPAGGEDEAMGDAAGNDFNGAPAAGGGDDWEKTGGAGTDSWESATPVAAIGGW